VTSGFVLLFSFLIPSIEEQYDRYLSKKVIDGYAYIGKKLLREKKYQLAEESFAKAFELSENKRLDIEMDRLRAKIEIINEEGEWLSQSPHHLKEVDFLYYLYLAQHAEDRDQISVAHSSYAIYLAQHRRTNEAREHFFKSIEANINNFGAHIDLGNLYNSENANDLAEKEYLKAIDIRPDYYLGHYNLGLLALEMNHRARAIHELKEAYRLKPDSAIARELKKAELLKGVQ
jgi:tetratricopeptide (TPR) repeat protein